MEAINGKVLGVGKRRRARGCLRRTMRGLGQAIHEARGLNRLGLEHEANRVIGRLCQVVLEEMLPLGRRLQERGGGPCRKSRKN